MFSVKHWQLDQNSCLPNDNVLCNIAAVLTAAEAGLLRDLGCCGSSNSPVPRRPQGSRCGTSQLCVPLWRSSGAAAWPWGIGSGLLGRVGLGARFGSSPVSGLRCSAAPAAAPLLLAGAGEVSAACREGAVRQGPAVPPSMEMMAAGMDGSPAAGFAGAIQPCLGWRGWLTRSPGRSSHRSGRQVARGARPPASLGTQQSLAVTPSKPLALTARSRGRKKRPPPAKNCKGEARAGAFIAGTLNAREEQGLSSLPRSLSCSTKQPPSLASEIQREVLKL